jgi:uncharacterized protein YjgD (DUF1641 family)
MLNTIDNQTASTENTTTEGAAIEQVEGAQVEATTTTEGEGSEQDEEEEEFVAKSKAEVNVMSEAERTVNLARLQSYLAALTDAIEGASSKRNQAEVNERTAIVKLFDSLKDHKVTMGEGQCAVKVSLKEALMGVKGKLEAGKRGDRSTTVLRDHTYKLPTKRADDIKKCIERLINLFNADPIRAAKTEGADEKGDATLEATTKTEGAEQGDAPETAKTEGDAPEANPEA